MQPLKFEPIFKSVIWGGEKIAPYKGVQTDRHQIGESWELSGVAGNESVVADGPYKGMKLPELVRELKGALVGEANYERFGDQFPLLVKFIDAQQDLSIQVHPDDRLAYERHRSKGKTEMWYVVAASEGAHLRSGFAKHVTPDEYAASVADHTICDILKDYPVREGDVFFLPAGRVHSIGAGSFIAEIQQTSDITYRIYDFDRKDAEGRTRELHTELAKGAIDYTVLDDYRTHYEHIRNCLTELVDCPYFTTDVCEATCSVMCDYAALDSFVVMIFLGGEGELRDNEGNVTPVRRGETVLVPASTRWVEVFPRGGELKFLTSCIKESSAIAPAE